MLWKQKEALLEDPSMKNLIRLFIYGHYRSELWKRPSLLTAKAKILYEKLYGSSDSSITDTGNTSENSEGACFKASSGLLGKV